MNGFLLWIAQGFGLGRVPLAPGTFGSLAGLLWLALLMAPQNFWILIAGTLAGLLLSVWISDRAEKMLRRTDPGSVVIDEISAVPLCFLGWIGSAALATGSFPPPTFLFSGRNWWATAGIFIAFRLFDVAKPWPIRRSQKLPGGWGITIDDALAALYVNAVVLLCLKFLKVL